MGNPDSQIGASGDERKKTNNSFVFPRHHHQPTSVSDVFSKKTFPCRTFLLSAVHARSRLLVTKYGVRAAQHPRSRRVRIDGDEEDIVIVIPGVRRVSSPCDTNTIIVDDFKNFIVKPASVVVVVVIALLLSSHCRRWCCRRRRRRRGGPDHERWGRRWRRGRCWRRRPMVFGGRTRRTRELRCQRRRTDHHGTIAKHVASLGYAVGSRRGGGNGG